jgi:hydrogenase expression/formation protein HypE
MTVDQASREAQSLGVDIVGGHTEISDSVKKMIVVSTAFGMVRKGGCVPLGKAMPGDSLIMTKTGAIEGSFIAANEHKDKLSGKVSEEDIKEALSYKNLISVVDEGSACGALRSSSGKKREDGFDLSAVNLMHDVTEGGVFGAAFEMADFSKTGVVIDKRLVPFTKATSSICSALGLDPFRLISSGSLMIASPEPEKLSENWANRVSVLRLSEGSPRLMKANITSKTTVLMSNCRLPGQMRYTVFDILSKNSKFSSFFRTLII